MLRTEPLVMFLFSLFEKLFHKPKFNNLPSLLYSSESSVEDDTENFSRVFYYDTYTEKLVITFLVQI